MSIEEEVEDIIYNGEEERWYQAAEEGNLLQLQEIRSISINFQWDERTCYLAARWGHLHVLKWLNSLSLPCLSHDVTWFYAIEGGHLDVLIWMKENGYFQWIEKSCLIASETNNIEILKWLRSQIPPCPWIKEECEATAREYENIEVLEWIQQN